MPSITSPLTLGSGMPAKLGEGPRTNHDLSRVGAGLGRGPNQKKKLTAAAWSNTWPAPGATLDLDFVNNRGYVRGVGQGGVMDAITFTRASSGNWVGSDGLLKTGAGTFTGTANATGVNLLTFPQDFDNVSWIKSSVTVTVNTAIAPDNTLTADLITLSSGLAAKAIFRDVSVGAISTSSIYIKIVSGVQYVQLLQNNNGNVYANFDVVNATTGNKGSGVATSSISSVGDGWYRLVMSTNVTNGTGLWLYVVDSNTSGYSPASTATGSYLLWGAQLELGSTATTYYPTNINVPRFDWASTAQVRRNKLDYTEQFDNAVWQKIYQGSASAPVVTADAGVAPNGTTTAERIQFARTATTNGTRSRIQRAANDAATSVEAGKSYTFSIWAKSYSGADQRLTLLNTSINSPTAKAVLTVTNDWQRFSHTYVSDITAASTTFWFGLMDAEYADLSSDVLVWGAQFEEAEAPSDYQAVAQLTTNTPLRPTATSNGLLIEESRANRILWCRDATQTNWTKTNVTAAKDQTGIDGVANAASSLTASAANGTCVQTITLASGSRTCSVYLKRITGTGNVQVSLDGSTWSTVDLSSTEWRRIVLSGTVTNPVVGIRLATNGDAVAMDYAQVEDGAFATSPILTTTASVTRSADSALISGERFRQFYRQDEGVLYAEIIETCLGTQLTGNSGGVSLNSNGNVPCIEVIPRQLDLSFSVRGVGGGGASQAFSAPFIRPPGFTYKAAMTYTISGTGVTQAAGFNSVGYLNTAGTQNSVFNINQLEIGKQVTSGTTIGTRNFKRVLFIDNALSVSALQVITGPAT